MSLSTSIPNSRGEQRATRLRRNLLLSFVSLVGTFAVIELVFRCWLPTPPLEWVARNRPTDSSRGDWADSLCESDPALGWRGVPSRRGEFTSAGVRVKVEHNSAGFRDVEHGGRAFDRRLVLLGDSFVWGAGVEQDDTVSAQVRRQLEDVDVYNLGVCGYGTDQSLLNFDRRSDAIRPTAVCYLFFANDVTDNQSRSNHGHAKPYFTLVDGEARLADASLVHEAGDVRGGEPVATPVNPLALVAHPLTSAIRTADRYVSPYSVLYRQVRRVNLEWRRRQPPLELDSLTAALILEMRRRCADRGAEFTVALIPDRGVMRFSNGPRHYAAVRAWCAVNDIDCLDLTPALLASPTNPYLFEGHWNATGHRVAAAVIAKHLSSERRSFAKKRRSDEFR